MTILSPAVSACTTGVRDFDKQEGGGLEAYPLVDPDAAVPLAQIHHVNVGSESHVVGKIPANVIGIIVDDNVVAIPIPVGDKCYISRRDTPVPVIEPEATRSTPYQAPPVRRTETSVKATVLPWLIEVIVAVIAASIMAHPSIAGVNVRGIGMARVVAEVVLSRMTCFVRRFGPRRAVIRFRSASRRRHRPPMSLRMLLRKCRQRYGQQCGQDKIRCAHN